MNGEQAGILTEHRQMRDWCGTLQTTGNTDQTTQTSKHTHTHSNPQLAMGDPEQTVLTAPD